ncbi:MAG: lanthionine synthetase LanC family protein [Aureispira sp.]
MITNQQMFLQTAYKIAKDLAKDAIWYEDTCNWTGHKIDAINGNFKVVTATLSAEPYSGLAGVATFLSRIVTKINEPILVKTLEGTVNSIINILKEGNELGNYGLFSGKLGTAYHLWTIGKQQNRPEWRAQGLEIITSLADIPVADHEIDIISGAAGAIPVLLEIHEKEQQEVFLTMAKKCGDFLLEKAQKTPQYWSWLTIPEVKYGLTGYSHGAAGIAVGLLELGIYTQDSRYLHAGTMGFNYENQWFDQYGKNWPDLREYKGEGKPNYSAIWCHGAPGIALARIRAYQLTGNQEHQYMAQVALETTYRSVIDNLNGGIEGINFSICHGVAGNSDILLSGAEFFNIYEYRLIAETVGKIGYEQFHRTGLPWPSGVNDPSGRLTGQTTSPSLMLGLAGTGYFYWRLAFPNEFSSVLLAGDHKKEPIKQEGY